MEIYKNLKGFENLYLISTHGNIKSIKRVARSNRGYRIIKERILKQPFNEKGYKVVSLSKNGKRITKAVHRLVANNFITKDKKNLIVDHKNNIKTDNRVENLQYITQRKNTIKDNKNKTGFTGVTQTKTGRCKAYIRNLENNKIYLGSFDTLEEASNAYQAKLNEFENLAI